MAARMPRRLRLNPLSPHIRWRDRGIDVLVGAVGVLALAPFAIWPFMLAMVAGLFLRAGRAGPREGWSTGFWTGMGYFGVGMFWIAQAFVERGPEFIPLIVPLVLGLFVLLSLFWGTAMAAYARLRSGTAWDVALFAGLLFCAEWLRGHLFGGFPWNLPGYAWEAGSALSQGAAWVGIYGLTLLVVLIGAGLGLAVRCRDRPRAALAPVAASALALSGLWGFGAHRLANATVEVRGDTLARLVYIPFRQREMMDPARAVGFTNDYFRETLSRPMDGITHIVWPEGAVRGVAMDNLGFLGVFASALEAPPPFLFSSIRVEEGPQFREGVRYFNTAVAVDYPDGYPRVAAIADKKRLVPFAEAVPLTPVMDAIGFEALAATFTAGADKAPVDYPGLDNLSVQICYEAIFPGLTEGEPDLILNQSNDAWFGNLHGPHQHAAITRMRAVEEGAPILRAAANGWSGLVDPYGRWVVSVSPNVKGSQDVTLVKRIAPTRYSGYVNLLLLVMAGSLALCAGYVGQHARWGSRAVEE